jgi:hypothetical protein
VLGPLARFRDDDFVVQSAGLAFLVRDLPVDGHGVAAHYHRDGFVHDPGVVDTRDAHHLEPRVVTHDLESGVVRTIDPFVVPGTDVPDSVHGGLALPCPFEGRLLFAFDDPSVAAPLTAVLQQHCGDFGRDRGGRRWVCRVGGAH